MVLPFQLPRLLVGGALLSGAGSGGVVKPGELAGQVTLVSNSGVVQPKEGTGLA